MGRIPTPTSRISAASGRSTAGIGARRASGAAFGEGTGRATQVVAGGMDQVAQGVDTFMNQKQQEDVANAVAQSDFTRRELELRNEVGPDAAGYQERALEEYDAWVEEQAEGIEDDVSRQQFKTRMRAQRPALSSRAAQYEMGTAATHSKDQANASLTTLDNKIRLTPDQYDAHIASGTAVIDARLDLPAGVREQMKTTWRQGAALSRFEGMLEAATSVEDVQAVQAELEGGDRDWTKELSSAGMERVLTLASSASKSIQTQADAAARSALETLEGRASDVTSVIPRDELMAVQSVVEQSNNPVTQARMARIVRDQELIAQMRRLTPEQQREVINQRYENPSLPPRLNTAVNNAARRFGVSPAYLAATAQREYGMFLTGNPDDIDYGKGNADGASSATGVMQFIDDTWLEVAKNPAFQSATGVNVAGMSDAQILELRKDPDIALMGGAFFTAQNAKAARAALGREPTDADLYVMHFMGRGGGSRLFRLVKSNPDMDAAHLFPEQAKANPNVYYKKDGTARTVRELYAELGRKHATGDGSETYYEYGDRMTSEKVNDDTERRLADDPMSFAIQVGTVAAGDLFGEGGMAERGEHARHVADYYGIAETDMKPFTKDEAATLSAQMKDGTVDDVLGILASVQQMGGDVARAAMRQISEDNDVLAYAGGLQLETGQGGVAADVVRGQKRLDENPAIRQQIGANDQEINASFVNATGGALLDAAPSQRQSIMDAAIAHYVETQVGRGRASGFDDEMFGASVQAVLGGRQGTPSLEDVNGSKTVMPPGVSGADMEAALQNMTVADWVSMSEQGEPPRYITGEIADPEDLADEAQLRAIGGGKYRVTMSDGSYLITGRPAANGQLELYIMQPTADAVRAVNDSAEASAEAGAEAVQARRTQQAQAIADANADGVLTSEEQQALIAKYGIMWSLDEEGRRIDQ